MTHQEQNHKRVVVVGVDGSPGAVAALRWAADEARLRDATLRLVTAWSFSPFALLPGASPPSSEAELVDRARHVQAGAVEAAGNTDALDVEKLVEDGPPVECLVAEAKDADLLVVGARGLGGFERLLLGSVSQQLAHHAPCPVVIVRDLQR